MKKLLSLLLCIVLMILITSCGQEAPTPEVTETTPETTEQTAPSTENQTETHERACVDIGVHEDGYYALMADVEICYDGDNLSYIYLENPALLAFRVSSEWGGAWVLKLDEGNQIIDELAAVAEALKAAGNTEYAAKIDAIIEIIANSGPYIGAST